MWYHPRGDCEVCGREIVKSSVGGFTHFVPEIFSIQNSRTLRLYPLV